jgi:hypothetical protein
MVRKAAQAGWRCPRCGQGFVQRNASHSCFVQDVETLYADHPRALAVVEAVARVLRREGRIEVAATKTQVSFRARTRCAWVWMPIHSLGRGPADVYVAIDLPLPVRSRRVKQRVEVRPGHHLHHVRVEGPEDVDQELSDWLRAAYKASVGGKPGT